MLPLVTHPEYSFVFPEKHRFPMQKFRLLYNLLVEQGIATKNNVFRPGRAKHELIALAHCPNYVADFANNHLDAKRMRRLGIPWSEPFMKRSFIAPAGTLLTAHLALKYGIACHLAGGTHHAHYDFGSGFCVFNDLAVAAKALQVTGKTKRILIFDCDVHQGDGTASILQNDHDIYTCSIHCEKNFPVKKANSDCDIGIEKHCEDEQFLQIVEDTLSYVLADFKPDFVFYDAGVDVYQNDPLGLLNITIEGLKQREHLVLSRLKAKKIPVATVIGGGYDPDDQQVAIRHGLLVKEAVKLYSV